MTPFRVGLIGAGWISRTYLAALARVPDGRPVVVWSRTRAHAERLAGEFALELATDRVEDLIAAVDVVCINSPNFPHAEHAIAAAHAGRHVIVEKPLAVSLEQGERSSRRLAALPSGSPMPRSCSSRPSSPASAVCSPRGRSAACAT